MNLLTTLLRQRFYQIQSCLPLIIFIISVLCFRSSFRHFQVKNNARPHNVGIVKTLSFVILKENLEGRVDTQDIKYNTEVYYLLTCVHVFPRKKLDESIRRIFIDYKRPSLLSITLKRKTSKNKTDKRISNILK